MAEQSCLVATDTATICIFDLAAMQHRKNDVGDWWSIPRDREQEAAKRNAMFVDVGDDGHYRIEVSQTSDNPLSGFCLATPSGRVFVGPGEEMSGGGFEPTGEWGGMFLFVDGPHQKVSVTRREDVIAINLQPTEPFENEPVDMIRLRDR